MRRFLLALVPALSLGAMFVGSLPAQAQIGGSKLEFTRTDGLDIANTGDVVSFDIFLTLRAPDAADPANLKFTSMAFATASDPGILTAVDFVPGTPFSLQAATGGTKPGIPAPYQTTNYLGLGGSQAKPQPGTKKFKLGSVSFTIGDVQTGGKDFVETTFFVVDKTNFPNIADTLEPALTISASKKEAIQSFGFKENIKVAPAPPALLVFALGGAAPALSMMRRRRKVA